MSVVRRSVRITAAALTIGVGGLAAVPAFAAADIAHGQASAINFRVNNMNAGNSGTFIASNDGTGETTSGRNRPVVTIPTGGTLDQGSLNQDAWAKRFGRVVNSSACAGLSGKGATLVAVGPSNCLSANNPPTASLSLGQLKLSTVTGALTNNDLFSALPASVRTALTTALSGLTNGTGLGDATDAANGIVGRLAAALGNPSILINAGVIQGACTATDGSTEGDSQFVNAGLTIDFGPTANNANLNDIKITLDRDPAPNTPLEVGVGDLTTDLTAAVVAQINSSATGTPLAVLADQLTSRQFDVIVGQIVKQITSQLGPLKQLVSGTLNKQTPISDSQIHVTALDLQVLPAASQFTGASLAALQLGDVDCLGGPVATPAVSTTPTNTGVPTDIDSGLAGDSGSLPAGVLTALGVLLLAGAGGVAVRRVRLHRSQD